VRSGDGPMFDTLISSADFPTTYLHLVRMCEVLDSSMTRTITRSSPSYVPERRNRRTFWKIIAKVQYLPQ
jgi:hypothetical protein